jgi:hypothetical protein
MCQRRDQMPGRATALGNDGFAVSGPYGIMPRMDLSPLLAGGKLAIDVGNLIVGTAGILQTLAASAPPIGPPQRGRTPERERAHLRFQQAAVELTTWVEYLPVLEAAAPTPATTRLYALAVAAQDRPGPRGRAGCTGSQTYTPALLSADGMASTLEKTLLLNETTSSQYMPVLLGALDQFRAATAAFLDALMEIRQVGNPGPRKVDEQITALLGELYGLVSVRQPPWWQRTVAAAFGRADAQRRKRQELEVCRQLLGEAHRDFTLAVRDDLGRDQPLRRFWWQVWRSRARDWPGGWPGPDAPGLHGRTAPHGRDLRRVPRRRPQLRPGVPDRGVLPTGVRAGTVRLPAGAGV